MGHKKHFWLSLILLGLLYQVQAQAQARSGKCGTYINWTFSDGTLTISGSGDMENYPDANATPWADFRNDIKTAVIKGVTSIGGSAFYDCNELTSVSISQSVTRFEAYAFTWCYNLTSIIIPKNVERIGIYAFSGCTNLTSIISLNGTPPNLNDNVFMGTDLSKITLHVPAESEKTYEEWWHFRRENIKPVIMWEDNNPFMWALSSSGVLTVLGDGPMPVYSATAAPWHLNLDSIRRVVIDYGITSIRDYAFSGCKNMTSVTIPQEVTSIGDYAFSGCEKMTSVILPQNMTKIEKSTFYGCSSLTSITIPQKVTSIEDSAFAYCSKLTSITNWRPQPQYVLLSTVFAGVPLSNITLFVLMGSTETYKNDDSWKQFGKITAALLSDLIVSEGRLSPEFDPETFVYELDVASSVSSLDIAGITNHPNAHINGEGTYSILGSDTSFNIGITFEGGFYYGYRVYVTKSTQESDAYLKNLSTSSGTLEPEFSPYITDYKVVLEDMVSSFGITATPNHPGAHVPNNGVRHLLLGGDTLFETEVISEDRSTRKTYRVRVEKTGHDATLKSLKVFSGMSELPLTPNFHPDVLDYNINLGTFASYTVRVEAETNHARAIVSGNGVYSLKDGKNDCYIMVTAEDLQYKRYSITINHAPGFGTDIPSVGAATVPVYFHRQILHVDSPVAEAVHIYSVAGTLLYRLEKPAGKTSFVVNCPKQVVIVKGGSGWAGKLIINN